MDNFQFVLEAPQLTQNHKKRPRLVTSCDSWYVAKVLSRCFDLELTSIDYDEVARKRLNAYRTRQARNVSHARSHKSHVASRIAKNTSQKGARLSPVGHLHLRELRHIRENLLHPKRCQNHGPLRLRLVAAGVPLLAPTTPTPHHLQRSESMHP